MSERDGVRVGAAEGDGESGLAVLAGGDAALPTVLVAGFGGALRLGLREVIGRDSELRLVGSDGESDVAAAIAEHDPDVAFVSYEALPSALELRRFVLAHPATGVVVAVMSLSRERDESLLAAGARIVVPITVEAGELISALRLVARGLVGPPRPRRHSAASGLGPLTAREVQVLELLVRRESASEIAEALHVSVATVNTHCRHIYEKLGVHSRREAALYAARLFGPTKSEPPTPAAELRRLPFRRRFASTREGDQAVVMDMCAALGARRWLGR